MIRFAPSPTGTFHIGNLRTAWIAWHFAQKLSTPLTLRFEDIDKPRVVPGALEKQLQDMAALGLVTEHRQMQSHFHKRHWDVFCDFLSAGRVYPCDCSRKQIRSEVENLASAPHDSLIAYTGRCRTRHAQLNDSLPTLAWRLKAPNETGAEDIVIARTAPQKDPMALPPFQSFTPAYNWACAIDDFDGQYSLIVRAWDLAQMAEPQRLIQKMLADLSGKPFAPAAIFHTALVVQNDGHRLEKRTRGITLNELLADHWTPNALNQAFAKSFVDPPAGIQPGELTGEDKREISLSQLLG